MIPMRISGTINLPAGAFAVAGATGARLLPEGPAGTALAVGALLPSQRSGDGAAVIRIDGIASSFRGVDLNLRATGALPDAARLAPAGTTWRTALSGAGDGTVREDFTLAQRTMWQVLMLPEVDAHLGNPGKGPSRSVFYFTSAKPGAPPVVAPVEKLRPGALALALVATALLIGNAVALWSKS
jgi:hypothetical protein